MATYTCTDRYGNKLTYNETTYANSNDVTRTLTEVLMISNPDVNTVEIPSNINAIADKVFENNRKIKSIIIPEGVTSIGISAFNGSTISSITLPESLITIDNFAFQNCVNLTNIHIPDNVETLGIGVFMGCRQLEHVNIPRKISILQDQIFQQTNISSITVPDNIVYIGTQVFYDCSNLSNIILPEGITHIGNLTFFKNAFTRIKLPKKLTEIKSGLFSSCVNMIEVDIPDNIEYISGSAFTSCTNLEYNTYKNAKYIGSKNNPYMILIRAEDSFGNDDDIHKDCKFIQDEAFIDHTALENIVIPDSVIVIGQGIFRKCSGLRKITIPFVGDSRKNQNESSQYPFGYIFGKLKYDGATLVAQSYVYNVFSSGISGMNTNFYIPSNLTEVTVTSGNILQGAFKNCNMLTKITISENVNSIDYGAFNGCSALEEIEIPFIGDCKREINDLPQYPFGYIFGDTSYNNSTNINGFYIPNSLKKVKVTGGCVPNKAFSNITHLENIELSMVRSIGYNAFYGCTELSNITLSSIIEYIGSQAFTGCTSLQYATDDYGNKYLTDSSGQKLVFIDVGSGVTDLKIDSECRVINPYACHHNTNITSVTIPNNTIFIGSSAFSGCSNLESLKMPKTIKQIGAWAFSDCYGDFLVPGLTYSSGIYINTYNEYMKDSYIKCIDNDNSIFYVLRYSEINKGNRRLNSSSPILYYQYEIENNCYIMMDQCFRGGAYYMVSNIPNTITRIPDNAFTSNLIGISPLPDSIEYIGNSAFEGSGVGNIAIPESVTTIGNYAFASSSITNITIPESVTTIGSYAFSRTQITSIAIPKSVKKIGVGIFNSCNNLKDITIPFIGKESLDHRDVIFDHYTLAYLFKNTADDIKVCNAKASNYNCSIPSTLKKITISGNDNYFMQDYTFISSKVDNPAIYINNAKGIGTNVFENANIETIDMSKCESILDISDCAFGGVRKLSKINFNNIDKPLFRYFMRLGNSSVTDIGNYKYIRLGYSDSAVVPITLKSIKAYAKNIDNSMFYGFSTLENITIYNYKNHSCKTIGNNAFRQCRSLQKLNIPSTIDRFMDTDWIATTKLANRSYIFNNNATYSYYTIGETSNSFMGEYINEIANYYCNTIGKTTTSITAGSTRIMERVNTSDIMRLPMVFQINDLQVYGNYNSDNRYIPSTSIMANHLKYINSCTLNGLNETDKHKIQYYHLLPYYDRDNEAINANNRHSIMILPSDTEITDDIVVEDKDIQDVYSDKIVKSYCEFITKSDGAPIEFKKNIYIKSNITNISDNTFSNKYPFNIYNYSDRVISKNHNIGNIICNDDTKVYSKIINGRSFSDLCRKYIGWDIKSDIMKDIENKPMTKSTASIMLRYLSHELEDYYKVKKNIEYNDGISFKFIDRSENRFIGTGGGLSTGISIYGITNSYIQDNPFMPVKPIKDIYRLTIKTGTSEYICPESAMTGSPSLLEGVHIQNINNTESKVLSSVSIDFSYKNKDFIVNQYRYLIFGSEGKFKYGSGEYDIGSQPTRSTYAYVHSNQLHVVVGDMAHNLGTIKENTKYTLIINSDSIYLREIYNDTPLNTAGAVDMVEHYLKPYKDIGGLMMRPI